MQLLGRHDQFRLIHDDGVLPPVPPSGHRPHLWRAVGNDKRLLHFLHGERAFYRDASVRTWARDVRTGMDRGPYVAFSFSPGVFLTDVLAQGAVEGGEIPLEAAVWCIAQVAKNVAALEARDAFPDAVADWVRVGFDGEVAQALQ